MQDEAPQTTIQIDRSILKTRSTHLLFAGALILFHLLRHVITPACGYPVSPDTDLPLALSPTSTVFSPEAATILYPFYHANIFHLLCNLWTYLAMIFYWHITTRQLVTAYIIAVIFGSLHSIGLLAPTSTIVGLSGLLFAMFGIRGLSVAKPLRYHSTIIITLAVTTIIPNVSVTAHLTCYVLGLLYALLTTPILQPYKRSRI